MISFQKRTKDKYAIHGMEHFINKFGIPVNQDDAPIQIVYGKVRRKKGKFMIVVKENSVKGKVVGKLEYKDESVSLFEEPSKAMEKSSVAVFKKGKRQFPCVSYGESEIEICFDVFKEIGHILSGSLEKVHAGNGKKRCALSKVPIVDFYENILFDAILHGCERTRTPLVHKDFWPEGKKFAVCLTHDVDEIRKTYQYITKPLKLARRGDFGGIVGQVASIKHKMKGKEPFWTFEDLIDTEKRLGVKSTFFFLKETADVKILDPKTWKHHGRRYDFKQEKVSKIIRKLHSGGWEIGLHGSSDSFNDLEKLKNEKNELEEVLKGKIVGTRQHNLNLDIPKTWICHEKIGLEYDTSLGHKNCVGFRWGISFPFYPIDSVNMETIGLLEIPLSVMDITLFSSKDHWEELLRIQRVVEKYSGVLTLLWHHTVFNNSEYPNWGRTYEEIIKVCENKNAWVTTAQEIAKWWKKREKSELSCEFVGNRLKISFESKGNHFIKVYLPNKMSAKFDTPGVKVMNKDKNFMSLKTSGGLEAVIK